MQIEVISCLPACLLVGELPTFCFSVCFSTWFTHFRSHAPTLFPPQTLHLVFIIWLLSICLLPHSGKLGPADAHSTRRLRPSFSTLTHAHTQTSCCSCCWCCQLVACFTSIGQHAGIRCVLHALICLSINDNIYDYFFLHVTKVAGTFLGHYWDTLPEGIILLFAISISRS